MSKKANPALIGAFVIGAVVLLVAAILLFGGGRLFRDTSTHVAYFEGSLKGLRVGANVNFRGVRIGEVTDISVTTNMSDLSFAIPVTFEIDNTRFKTIGEENYVPDPGDDTMDELIQRGLRAQLNVQSFVTGMLEVELDFFPATEIVYRGEGRPLEVPTIPSTAQQLAEKVREFFEGIQDLPVDEVLQNIGDAAAGLDRLANSKELADTLAGLDALVNDADTQELTASLRASLAQFDRTMTDARETLQGTRADIGPLIGKVGAALEKIESTVSELEKTVASIRSDLTGQSEVYYQFSSTLEELRNAARSLGVLADYLERHPEALLRGKPNP